MHSIYTCQVSNPKAPNLLHQRRACPSRAVRGTVLVRAKKAAASPSTAKGKEVTYGSDWYSATRENSKRFRTVREEIEYRREANRLANNGKERKDLYSANWDGDKYKGGNFNILTVIAAISVLVPLAGLAFAYTTYGVLWG